MKRLLLPALASVLLGFAPALVAAEAAPAQATATLHADRPGALVHPEVYGQFTEHLGHCIYGGLWVGPDSKIPNTRGIRNDVLAALKDLHIPVIRWPGGCFADEYHWMDGIGPRDKRPAMINTNWGGVTEDNSFGTHEFLDFCEMLGTEPYISGNVGSGTVKEMMDWVEYMTSDADSPLANLRRKNGRDKPWHVKYFAIGNETWGCGGSMRPEYYADLFRRYNTFLKNYGDNKLFRIASGANSDDTNWTEVLLKNINDGQGHPTMNAVSLHYYTIPTGEWSAKGSATQFGEDQWFSTLKNTLHMEELVTKHIAVLDKYDPQKKVGLFVDEWGTWTDVEPGTNPGFLFQQNTLRDALVAAINFHIFQHHADRVTMSNIAQMINVLQAMILTDGPRMLRTPTYWVFEMFKVHQGATVLPLDLLTPDYEYKGDRIPAVSGSATRATDGRIHVSLANADPHRAVTVTCALEGLNAAGVSGRILTAPEMTSHNTFDQPDAIMPKAFDGAKVADGKLTVTLPAKSVVVLELR